MDPQQALQSLHFGRVDAETDNRLNTCFVGTEMLRQALLPQHSLFVGAKGSGKSALFRSLCGDLSMWRPLLPKNYEIIFRIPATGLQSERYLSGVDLHELSPETANDFRAFWLLYIGLKTATTLVEDKRMQEFVSLGVNAQAKQHYDTLEKVVRVLGLVEAVNTVEKIRQKIDDLVVSPQQSPVPQTEEVGKILSVTFRNRTGMAIITLLDVIDSLLQETKCIAWILLDKLDLLFFEDVERLRTSITGLVQLLVEYSDRFKNIQFKVFLRRDIYRQLRIVNKSHLVSYTNDMKWRGPWLIKLLAARAVSDQNVREYCEAMLGEPADVGLVINGKDDYVLKVFYSIFEPTMGIVKKERAAPTTHEWILKRLVDGLGMSFPREIIHLGNVAVARQRELNKLEGKHASTKLVSARALRLAFDAVSAYRCDSYLNAEFPHLLAHFDVFKGKEGGSFRREELYSFFDDLSPSSDDAVRAVHDVGLLTPIGKNVDSARRFEIPLLYRSGLGITGRRPKRRTVQRKTAVERESIPVEQEKEPLVEESNIPLPQFV